ncbi:hypothetical protein L195_g043033 [Trifolium pratense]|uniref:Uncharacterized protein n=1 Tax=Trifolium pratense TaxID=57577 RepID=A0A2K3M848_TRIPR|nr:hypothetical protein L195_g043033 [Trifolium pratense]
MNSSSVVNGGLLRRAKIPPYQLLRGTVISADIGHVGEPKNCHRHGRYLITLNISQSHLEDLNESWKFHAILEHFLSNLQIEDVKRYLESIWSIYGLPEVVSPEKMKRVGVAY